MRILVQKADKLKFIRADSVWVDEIESAMDFQNTANAIRCGLKLHVPFLVRFHFEDSRMDFTLDYERQRKKIPHIAAQIEPPRQLLKAL